MSQIRTRHLGGACRIYKNNADKVIAIDELSVTVDLQTVNVPTKDNTNRLIQKQIVSPHLPKKKRTLVHLTTGGSRVVSTIQMIGDYSTIEENGGDFFIATWTDIEEAKNTVQVSFEQAGVAKVGDTV